MAKRSFLERHRIRRNAIREDLLFFVLPAFLVFVAGLVVSVVDGWQGISGSVRNLVLWARGVQVSLVPDLAGLFLIALGFTTMFTALATLRKNYSSTLVIREDHRLVTHGIYHFTRHPIYLGVIMVLLGIPASVPSLYGLVTMSALIPVFLYRIRIEERLLIEEFGDAYCAYQDATSKLIPFIY